VKIDRQKIETILAEKNMSKADFAAACGYSKQYLYVILNRGGCNTKTANKLANALGVSASKISTVDVEKTPDQFIDVDIRVDTSELDESMQKIDRMKSALMELQEMIKNTH